MKAISLALLIAVSSWAVADDVAIENYMQAQLHLLQAQVQNLRTAVDFMRQEPLSDQDIYELVGQPGFAAMDVALADFQFTAKTFYQFQADNDLAIVQWLTDHGEQATQIDQLQFERDLLSSEFEQLTDSAAAGQ